MAAKRHRSEQQILDWLAGQRGAMLALLETLVNTDSGSYDKAGRRCGRRPHPHVPRRATASPARSTPDDKVRRRHQRHGRPIRRRNRPILLMGHRDTVFPKGEPTRRPFKIEGDRAYGPGVSDMKSGLVMNCFVLAALKKFGGAPRAGDGAVHRRRGDRLAVLARGDRAASRAPARAVFNSEPGRGPRRRGDRPQGRRVHALRDHRQGGAFRRQLRGRHQRDQRARAQDAGAACAERCRRTASRSTSAWCRAGRPSTPWRRGRKGEVDLRFITPAQRAATMAKVEEIMAKSFVPGTTRASSRSPASFCRWSRTPTARRCSSTTPRH